MEECLSKQNVEKLVLRSTVMTIDDNSKFIRCKSGRDGLEGFCSTIGLG